MSYITYVIHKYDICHIFMSHMSYMSYIAEYNMKNIFLEKLYTICGGKTSPRPFSEKLEYISGSIV